jgi:antitoxin component YwqK of YwqJK toxin-antitoxin module
MEINITAEVTHLRTVIDADKEGINYIGDWACGGRCEIGKQMDKNGTILYEGEWHNNQPHGQGHLYNKMGDKIYGGSWVDGSACGQGTRFYKGNFGRFPGYVGLWSSNKASENGIAYSSTNTKCYDGQWMNGKPHGRGISFQRDGVTKNYEGNFTNGMLNGNGIIFYSNGINKWYDGQWLNGKPHGHGIRFDKDGVTKTHEGTYVDGIQNGHGIVFYLDGVTKQYEGEFKNGQRHGHGIIFNEDGVTRWFEGEFKNNKVNGYGTLFSEDHDSKMYEGTWSYNDPIVLCEGYRFFKDSVRQIAGQWKFDCRNPHLTLVSDNCKVSGPSKRSKRKAKDLIDIINEEEKIGEQSPKKKQFFESDHVPGVS